METADCQLFLCLKDINLINALCKAHSLMHTHTHERTCAHVLHNEGRSVDSSGKCGKTEGKPRKMQANQVDLSCAKGIDCPVELLFNVWPVIPSKLRGCKPSRKEILTENKKTYYL